MWRATVLTLFPEMFPGPLGISLAGKALSSGLWALEARDIRDAATDKHRSVDDTPAGGGPGMVLRADVLAAAIDGANIASGRPRLLMSPRGRPLTQKRVMELAAGPGPLIVCGRFEGIDQRVIEARELEEISMGDYVLSGGEIAALALIDACVRLLPGVMGKLSSGADESFSDGLPPIYPPAGLRGPDHPGRAGFRRPRQSRGLAASGGRGPDPGTAAGPLGRQDRSNGRPKHRAEAAKRHDNRVTTGPLWRIRPANPCRCWIRIFRAAPSGRAADGVLR
jgi:tRNA (guanine37-N1)-methyltransferase